MCLVIVIATRKHTFMDRKDLGQEASGSKCFLINCETIGKPKGSLEGIDRPTPKKMLDKRMGNKDINSTSTCREKNVPKCILRDEKANPFSFSSRT